MALVTLFFLLAFTALNLGKSLDSKWPLLDAVAAKVEAHLDSLALWGVVYCAVMALLTLLYGHGFVDVLVRFAANIAVVVMALPYAADKIVDGLSKVFNSESVNDHVKGWARWSIGREKTVGIAGAVISLLLFAIVFR